MEKPQLDIIQEEKIRLRQELSAGLTNLREPGRVAQQLRGFQPYRRAERIFVSPARELSQVRINCLVDGKELIVAGPALKSGIYGFQAYSIDFKDLEHAVSFKGIEKYGNLLDLSRKQPVDLFLTDGLALNDDGVRLGDGNGFFDLAFALLVRSCPGNAWSPVVMACNQEQVISEQIPRAPWDIDADFYISSSGFHEFNSQASQSRNIREKGPIFWQQLSYERIKKVTPLWNIWKNRS
ncbi:MAG: 5-formyltetrahydrofolate cyclo-ligase [Desulfurivibrionaceae bacterium]